MIDLEDSLSSGSNLSEGFEIGQAAGALLAVGEGFRASCWKRKHNLQSQMFLGRSDKQAPTKKLLGSVAWSERCSPTAPAESSRLAPNT